MNRFIWTLKQLLPLSYRSTYTDSDGARHLALWRMWFGRCFGIVDVKVLA